MSLEAIAALLGHYAGDRIKGFLSTAMHAGPEEVEVVGHRSEADPCSTVVDGVWIGEMAGAPFTVDVFDLGAVDLRKPVGELDAVGEVGRPGWR